MLTFRKIINISLKKSVQIFIDVSGNCLVTFIYLTLVIIPSGFIVIF